mgnify:FL=1
MKSGLKLVWTDNALEGLGQTFQYLELNFSEREIKSLARKIESTLAYILKFPELYPESIRQKGVRRAVVTKFNTIYYRLNSDKNQMEILSFFSNRQNPEGFKY